MRPEPNGGSGYVARRLALRLAFLLIIAGIENALGWDSMVVPTGLPFSGVMPYPCNLQRGADYSAGVEPLG